MRVWVARAEPAAARTAARLWALGHEPLVAPVLTIGRTGEACPTGRFDAILLTSANAVDALAERGAQGAPIYAVGPRTAERAQAAGLEPVIAAEGDAGSLAKLVRGAFAPDASLLHVAGEDRKPEPTATLRRAGFAVTTWPAYSASAVAVLPDRVAAALSGEDTAPPLSAVLHYSRRSAGIALALVREAGLSGPFGALRHHCLSADVAVPLVEAGIAAHFVPARPEEEALLAGLTEASPPGDSQRGGPGW